MDDSLISTLQREADFLTSLSDKLERFEVPSHVLATIRANAVQLRAEITEQHLRVLGSKLKHADSSWLRLVRLLHSLGLLRLS